VRTLFIGPTRLGDAILVSGILDWLHRDDPRGTVTIACGAPAAMALALAPGLSKMHVMHKRRWSQHWFALWRDTKHRKRSLDTLLSRCGLNVLGRLRA
jgi:ADP-heptose:LPS heptosyltransferase